MNVIGVEERYVMNENDLNAVLKEGEGIKQFTSISIITTFMIIVAVLELPEKCHDYLYFCL